MLTSKEYKKELEPELETIIKTMTAKETPIFIAVAMCDAPEVNEETIKYKYLGVTPRAAGISLKSNDYLAEFMKIINGFVAQPRQIVQMDDFNDLLPDDESEE